MSILKGTPTCIPEYFAGQSILMTGGTGLMGKVLVEKILRSCPEIKTLYLFMRPKRSGSVQERWEEIKALPVFDVLKETNPNAFSKVYLVEGDISKENLGLSEKDRQILIENVTIVYHSAAMIQFTDNLYELLIRNTKATYLILELAKQMVKLQLFLYVSTTYSNVNIPCHQAEERVIPACQDWRVILKVLDREPLVLGALKEQLMCGHPNAYTWSKSMAENIVHEYRNLFPTVIARPAVLYATFREPFEGWADLICGIASTTIPIGLGLMRVTYARYDSNVDYIPIDIANNALLVASWRKHLEPRKGETDVYNLGIANQILLTTADLKKHGREALLTYTSKNVIWPMHCLTTTNDTIYYYLFILFQVIPSAIMDLLLMSTGNKPMILKLTIKLSNVFRLLRRFTTEKFSFPNDRFLELENYVNEKDKKAFTMNLEGLTVKRMMMFGLRGVLKYYFKEDISEEALKKNRRRLFWLEILDKCLIYTFYLIFAWLIFRYLASFESLKSVGYMAQKMF